MFKGFKATRNPKRCNGRSQRTNEGEADALSGKNVRKETLFMSLEANSE